MGTITIWLWGLIAAIKIGVLAAAPRENQWPPNLPERFNDKKLLQSPINIVTNMAKEEKCTDLKMETILKKADNCVTMRNTGRDVELNIANCINKPILTGGPLDHYNSSFVFDSLHYHWGEESVGSEHLINGQTFQMEGHLIYVNKHYYPRVKDDKGDEYKKNNGIAVLAFFIKVQDKKNSDAQPMIDKLSKIQEADTTTQISVHDAFDWISSILTLSNYYSYPGSLTSGKCDACVTWIVFPKTVFLSSDQIAAFRELQTPKDTGGKSSSILSNIHPAKLMNGRPLLHCK